MKNMKLIETKTVGAGGVASVTFSSIPQTYTDLKIVMSARVTSGGNTSDNAYVTFNGTTDRYYEVLLYGAGTSSGSVSAQNANAYLQWSGSASGSSTTVANTFSNAEVYIANYTSSNSKSVTSNWVNIDNSVNGWAGISSGLWNPTSNAPITSITIAARSAATSFIENSTFYLYGVPSTVTSGAKAYGGIVYEDTSYYYHVFTSSSKFTPKQSLSCETLVIAGGGGGGRTGGGGGAGGLRGLTSQSMIAQEYTITVGSGGAGNNTDGQQAGDGGNSSISGSGFSTITATGGGGAASYGNGAGRSGGSGGGANGIAGTGGSGNAGGYTPVEGYAGGAGGNQVDRGGGGGGASQVGAASTGSVGGNGGNGSSAYSSWGVATGTGENISGTYWYAGGGGGASGTASGGPTKTNQGAGGNGGGGDAVFNAGLTNFSEAGLTNTGGGGGAGAGNGCAGANGGSGLVIVRYAK